MFEKGGVQHRRHRPGVSVYRYRQSALDDPKWSFGLREDDLRQHVAGARAAAPRSLFSTRTTASTWTASCAARARHRRDLHRAHARCPPGSRGRRANAPDRVRLARQVPVPPGRGCEGRPPCRLQLCAHPGSRRCHRAGSGHGGTRRGNPRARRGHARHGAGAHRYAPLPTRQFRRHTRYVICEAV